MSDAPFSLRPRAAPPGFPPDAGANQVIYASHINAIRDSVALWPGDVNGQGHVLSNVAFGAGVTLPAHAHAAADVTSGVFATARLGAGAASASVWLRGDGAWAAPPVASQTPWTSHIDAAGFELRGAGNVGIGTASPDSRITVVGNGAGGQLKIASFTDASTANGIGPLSASVFLGNHFAQNPGAILLGANSIALAVGDGSDADGQRKLTVGSNGSVGIGTLAPTSKLSFGSGAPNITQRIALFEDAGGVGFRGIGMANPAAGVYGVGIYAGNAAPTDTNMALFVRDNSGNVGIGTANPGSKLSVVGLPTSIAGLSAGDIWIDTAAGRVLKIA